MSVTESEFQTLYGVKTLDGLGDEEALDHLARLIDFAHVLRRLDGTEQAIQLGAEFSKRTLSPSQAIMLDYYLSNAWANLGQFRCSNPSDAWAWEQPEIEKEIIHLRRAFRSEEFDSLPSMRRSQILTNLGNLLNTVGRFAEAIEYWDRALDLIPDFGMALGNKGYGLFHYLHALYDDGHQIVFARFAHDALTRALSIPTDHPHGIDPWAKEPFTKLHASLRERLHPDDLQAGTFLDEYPLGKSKTEVAYRRWCLTNRLFLNPLNDLGPFTVAARDILTTPSIVMKVDEGPYYHGFYNQLKQEYVSARYLHYEGISSDGTHFSDRDVLLYNTLDYPTYSLAVEKVKLAFRASYSLLDKVAFFLNHYLRLGIPERRVGFRTLWYDGQERKRGLRADFQTCDNWPLRGLFWLCKDLFENAPEFRAGLEPDAHALDDLRNHVEHKYLKLHEDLWVGQKEVGASELSSRLTDVLAHSTKRDEFEAKGLRLLKIARAALIYLSLTIHHEEGRRRKGQPGEEHVISLALDCWEDDWKR